MKSVTSAQMAGFDWLTINKYGVPSLILMERAGKGIADEVIKRLRVLSKKGIRPRVAVFCGKGNNGGDGMVASRYLLGAGIATKVCIIGDGSFLKGDAQVQLMALKQLGLVVSFIRSKRGLKRVSKFNPNIIIDAIFGTGFKGSARGIYSDVIEFISRQRAYIFSADVPSGMDATTGKAEGPYVEADTTITMGIAKRGFFKNRGPATVGSLKIIDIGIREV